MKALSQTIVPAKFQICDCNGIWALASCKKGRGICKLAVATLLDYGTKYFSNFLKTLCPMIVPTNFQTGACGGFWAL